MSKRRPATTWADLQALRELDLGAPCPDPECDEGWVDDGRCSGHVCGNPVHYGLDYRLKALTDELDATLRQLVTTMFGKGNDGS